jgi:outer membrane protein insertion porin family
MRDLEPNRGVRRAAAGVLLALLLLTAPSPGGLAQTGFDGRTIQQIQVEGLKTLSPETILFYLDLEEGAKLDEKALNEKIKNLWSRQLVDDIAIDAFPGDDPDSVRLVVRVAERPLLLSVEYENIKRINRTDITDRILSDNINVLEQTPLSIGELERVSKVIEDLYHEKGYRFADASYTLDEVEPNRYAVTFTVDEGDRVRIAKLRFDGNTVFRKMRLKWMMKGTKESGLISRILKKDIYNPAKLEEDLQKIRDAYKRRGYKNVTIGEPTIEVRALHPEASDPDKQKRRMFIEIPIEEGERWRLGEISIEGNERFSDQALLAIFQHKSGAWLKSKKIEDAIKSIDDVYQNNGYIYARVEPELRERGDNVADLIVHIQESDQYRIGRIEFEGNTRTRDKVLRRELRVQEGYLMNSGGLRNSVLKVNQLGYFQLDEEEPIGIDVDSEEKKVNLVFKGQEADRTELQFGGGWSEAFGFEGQFTLRTRNFLGRGETLGVQFQSGRFRDLLDLSYFVPWFLDRPQTVGLRVFDQNFSFDVGDQDFEQDQQGFQLTYGRSLRLFQQAAVVLSFSDRNDVFASTIDNDGDGLPDPIRLNRTFVSLRPTWVFDSRNSRFEATRGQRISLSVEFAGGLLGGDNELIRPQAQYSLFKPVTRTPLQTVLALNVETGYLQELGDQLLSPFERYYLGGESSIRGHRVNSIFVRDENGLQLIDPDFGVPLGGNTFVQLNLEYHLLLGGPLRLLWFFDAGNVYGKDQGIDLGQLRTTTGLEMRILVPVFGAPLRFIYAVNLDELPAFAPDGTPITPDDFEGFQFQIGTSF